MGKKTLGTTWIPLDCCSDQKIPLMSSSLETGASQVLPVPWRLCCCLTYLHMKEFQYSSNRVDFSSLAGERAEHSSQIPCTVAMVLPWAGFQVQRLCYQGKNWYSSISARTGLGYSRAMVSFNFLQCVYREICFDTPDLPLFILYCGL